MHDILPDHDSGIGEEFQHLGEERPDVAGQKVRDLESGILVGRGREIDLYLASEPRHLGAGLGHYHGILMGNVRSVDRDQREEPGQVRVEFFIELFRAEIEADLGPEVSGAEELATAATIVGAMWLRSQNGRVPLRCKSRVVVQRHWSRVIRTRWRCA